MSFGGGSSRTGAADTAGGVLDAPSLSQNASSSLRRTQYRPWCPYRPHSSSSQRHSAIISAASATPQELRLKKRLPSATYTRPARTAGRSVQAACSVISARRAPDRSSARVRATEKPHGARRSTSASASAAGPGSTAECPPRAPCTIVPPAASTSSAIQYPLPIRGASHSRCATRGRRPGAASGRVISATALIRARRCRTSRSPRAGTPRAAAIRPTSPSTSSNVVGLIVTMRAAAGRSEHAARTSSSVTAQMRHCSWVRITVGAQAVTVWLRIWYTGPPLSDCARTATSMSREGAEGSM
mmetsp:Transcript_35013/g.68947  ORF Transcript_35013/g.68947 Transcript_35013/m.68947 type:complete len:300 (+) Transcript_35013:591-1490(+)